MKNIIYRADSFSVKDNLNVFRFFRNLENGMGSAFKRYFRNFPRDYKEYGFDYKERQLHTFVAPSIVKLTKGYCLMECPGNRKRITLKKKKNDEDKRYSSGFIDYWCNYKSASIILEIKHHWFRFNKTKEGGKIVDYGIHENKIDVADKQLRRVRNLSEFWYKKKLYTVAMHVVPIFYKVKDKGSRISNQVIKNALVENEAKYRQYKLDLVRLYSLSPSYVRPFEFGKKHKKTYELYPFVLYGYMIREKKRRKKRVRYSENERK